MPMKRKIKLKSLKHKDISNPTLVSFPQNIPPRSFLSKDSSSRLQFTLHQHKMLGKDKTIITGENDIMKYIGTSFTNSNLEKKQSSNFIVGFYDKESQSELSTINLIPVDHVFTLSQYAKNSKNYTPSQEHLYKNMEYKDHKSVLVNDFGTKKAKQRVQQLKNNIVEEDSINTAKQMNKALKQEVIQLK